MFRYRLEPVLKYRKALEDERRRSLAEANRQYLAELGAIKKLEDERAAAVRRMGDRLGAVNRADEMMVYDDFLKGSAEDLKTAAANAERTQLMVEVEREKLLEAVKKRKIIEAHRAALELRHNRGEARRERAAADEIALMRFIRERPSGER